MNSFKRDYNLIKNGSYNMRAIMQRAWAYMKIYKGYYSFKQALRSSWIDAHIKMDELNNEEIKMNHNRKLADFLNINSAVYHEVMKFHKSDC